MTATPSEPIGELAIEPLLTVREAILLAERHAERTLGYEAENTHYRLHREDLEKLAAMGLASLPVEAVAVPEASPLLCERTCLSASLDYARRLSAFFPVYFVAAMYELQSLIRRFGVKAYVVGGIPRDMLLFQEKGCMCGMWT